MLDVKGDVKLETRELAPGTGMVCKPALTAAGADPLESDGI